MKLLVYKKRQTWNFLHGHVSRLRYGWGDPTKLSHCPLPCKKKMMTILSKKTQIATKEVHANSSSGELVHVWHVNRKWKQSNHTQQRPPLFKPQITYKIFHCFYAVRCWFNSAGRENKQSAEYSTASWHKSTRCNFWTGCVALVRRKYAWQAANSTVF